MAVFTWQSGSTGTGTFDVVTRSGSYTSASQLIARSGTYSIDTQVSLRSGSVTLYQQSSGYVTTPMTAFDIMFDRSILSPIISTPFNNNVYNTALYKNTQIYKSVNAYVDPSSIVFDDALINSEKDLKFISDTLVFAPYRFSASGTINASNQASAKVTFKPAGGTGLFTISGQHGTRVFVPNWIGVPADIIYANASPISFVEQGKAGMYVGYSDATGQVGSAFGHDAPFGINFLGQKYQALWVSSGGYIQLLKLSSSGLQQLTFPNSPVNINNPDDPNNPVIKMFASNNRRIYYIGRITTGTAPNRKHIIRWEGSNNTPAYGNNVSGASHICEVTFFEGKDSLQIHYKSNENTGIAAIQDGYGPSTSYLATWSPSVNAVSPFLTNEGFEISWSSFRNQASAKVSFITSGSGTINVSNQASAKVTFDPADGTGLFTISGQLGNIIFKPNWVGSGLATISGTAGIRVPIKFSGSGTFTETGTASQATARVAFIPINTIILYNTNAITKLAMQYAGKSPTTPFGGLEIVFEELEANAPPQQFKYTGSASAPKTTVKVSSTGILQISGTGSYKQPSLVGSGSISLSGQHGVNVFKPNWITSGNIVVQSAAATSKQLRFVGSGSLPALISKLELLPVGTTQYQHRTNVLSDITKYFRTNISSVTSATSIPNPVTGLTGDSAVYNVVTSSSGSVFAGYLDPRSSTGVFATNTTVFMSIFAKANTWGKFRLVAYSSVFGSSGALPNHEIQYDVSLGTATNLQGTNAPLDYGIVPYSNGWYRCWIKLNVRVASDQSGGSGWFQIKFSSDSSANNSMYWYGPQLQKDILTSFVENTTSAALTTTAYLDGGSDVDNSLTYADNDTLFFTTSGTARIKAPNRYIGASPIAYYDPSEIVFGEGDIFYATQLKITSQSQYTRLNKPPESSGSLFAVSGASQSTRFKPADGTGLFAIGNQASAKVVFKAVDGTGLFSISGQHGTRVFVPNIITSGTINASNQASAKVSFKASDGTGIGTLTGAAGIKAPNRHIGASPIAYYDPSEIVFGEGDNFYATQFKITSFQSQYRFIQGPTQYTASGSLFAVGGASQSTRFKPADGTGLFTFSGQLGNNIFKPNWITSGTINLSNQASARVLFRPVDGTGLFTFTNGYSNFKATESWLGSGIINASNQASAKISFKPAGGTGLFTFVGSVVENRTSIIPAGSGTITISGAYNNFKAASAWSGSGSTTFSNGYSNLKATESWLGSGTATFGGTAIGKVANKHIGASPIAYYDPNEIVFGEGDIFYATQFKITSQSQYTRLNKPPQSSGSLFAVSGASNSTSFKASDGTGLFAFTNSAVPKQTNITTGSGTISISNQASAAVSFRPANGTGLFTFTNGYSNLNASSVWIGSGTATFSGAAGIKAPNRHIGASPIAYYDPNEIVFGEGDIFYATQFKVASFQSIYRLIQGPVSYQSSGSLFAIGGASQSTRFKPADGTGLFSISGQLGNNIFKPNWITSGTINVSDQASAKVTFEPADGTGLFTFTNGYSNLKATESWLGSGTINASNQASAAVSFKPAGGTGLFAFTNGYSNLNATSKPAAGNGTITLSGAYSNFTAASAWSGSGSITLSGAAVLKQRNVSIDGSGTTTFSGTAIQKVANKHIGASPIAYYDPSEIVFGEGDIFYATQFKITSQSQYTKSNKLQSSGSLFAGSQASAVVSFKPADGTGLFTFTNSAGQKHIDIASGSGTITLSGAATLPLFAKYSGSGSVTLSGSGVENQTDRPTAGSGTISISNQASAKVTFRPVDGTGLFTFIGSVIDKHIDVAIGSGTISSLSGGAERVAFKLADGTGLFTFTNGYSNLKASSVWIGSGTTTLSGAAGIKAPNRHIGASPIAYYDPNEIVFGEGDNFYATQFKITSFQSQYRFIQGPASYQSSGSLFAVGGASQSTGSNPPEGTYLFTFSGQLGNNIFKPNWIASGTINLSNQASAKVIFKPADGTGLFTFTNSAVLKQTNISIDGSGTISSLSGGAEKVTFKALNGTGLFTFSDGYSNLNATTRPAAGSGTITLSGAYSNFKAASAWNGSGSVTLSGSAGQKHIDIASGSGTITLSGAAVLPLLAKYSGSGSATLSGSLVESQTDRPAAGSGTITLSGAYSNFTAASAWSGSGSITLSGSAVPKQTNISINGSGTINASNQASAKVTFKPAGGTGLFTFSGQLGNNIFKPNWITSGTINISQQASAAVSFKALDGTGLFTFTNSAVPKQTNIAIDGSGTLTLSGAATLPLLAKYFGSGSATLSGSATESQTDRPAAGSGTINASNQASAAVSFKPAGGTGLFTFTNGYSNLKATNISIDGSGSLFSSGFFSNLKVAFRSSGTGLFTFSGQHGVNVFKPNWITSGTINISQQASAAVSFKALDGTGLFTFTNSAVPKQTNTALNGSGTITLSGAAVLPLLAKYFGSGSATLSGSLVERETNRTSGSGTINASNQASAAVSFKPAGGTGLFAFTNGYSNLKATNISVDGSGSLFGSGFFSNLKVTFRSPGTGLFTFSGQHGVNVFKPNWIASGTISISNQASAAVSFKVVDGTGLFTFSNAAILKKTNISIDGSGTINASNQASAKVTFKEVNVTGLFSVSGTAIERETNRPAAGSGTINIGQQASAAISFKANDGTGLFTFTNGYSNLKATEVWVGSGSATLSGSAVEKQRQIALGSGSATLSGTATERQTDRPVAGSGTISISNQASAAVLFKPAGGTGLFAFTNGYSNLKATDAWLGSGSVTIDSTSTAKVVWVPSAGTGLFDITGTAGIKLRDWIFVSPIVEFDPYEFIINDDFVVTDIIKLYQRWNATNNVEGSSAVSSTNIHQSSGSLFADSTASATVTFNPTEGDPFFVISGSALDSHTEVAVASGTATISGSVTQSQTNLPAAGSGTIITSNLASAKVTFKPADGTGLFSISGSLVEKQIEVAVGSGTINASNQASAAVSFKAVDGTGLFTFAGSVVEKQTDITSGSGTIITSNLASAKVTFKPADGTGLFTFSGSVVETQTEVATGSGSITISGNAIVPVDAKYFGSGSATISGTATESQTDRPAAGSGTTNISDQASAKVTFKPADGTGLFTFSGSVVEKQTEVATGSGTISISDQASAKVTFKPADGTGLFSISGSVVETQTEVSVGSGTIITSNLASAKVTFKPADGTGLFTFSGQLGNNIFKPNWITSGTINVSNQASAAVSFKPAEGTGLFTFSGSVVQNQINRTSGSGTINASNQASAKVTFKPAEGTGLFGISGSLVENRTSIIPAGSGTISISNQSSAAVSFKPAEGTGLFSVSGSVVQSQTNKTFGFGTISISDQASAKVIFKPAEGTGLFTFSGQLGNNIFKPNWITSGSISISNQAAAAVSFKTVDGTGLFTFTNGYSNFKASSAWLGSGTINASDQASAAVSFKPAEGTGLFSISGSLGENQTNTTSGSGTISISNQAAAAVSFKTVDGTGLFTFTNGYSNFKASSAWLGSGTINASDQASAAVSFKPAEGTGLFTISGNANIVVKSNYGGSGIQLFSYIDNVIVYTTSKLPPFSGVTFVSGDSSNSTQYSNVGSGTINVSNEASAEVTFSASSSTALFEISGEALIRVPNYRGSGIINVGNQASATVTFKPADGTGLFAFTNGYSNLKITDVWLGSGSLFSIGSSPQTRTFTWQTEPREISYLFSGAAEYDKVTSYESTILLNIFGTSRVKTELPERIFATII